MAAYIDIFASSVLHLFSCSNSNWMQRYRCNQFALRNVVLIEGQIGSWGGGENLEEGMAGKKEEPWKLLGRIRLPKSFSSFKAKMTELWYSRFLLGYSFFFPGASPCHHLFYDRRGWSKISLRSSHSPIIQFFLIFRVSVIEIKVDISIISFVS